jgi:DNA helicase II / ATP-dependent DNA helicase PcrA
VAFKKSKPRPVLNAEQQSVVEHAGGPLRVSACAGSGKTTALVERVAYLIEHRHVPPSRILVISFSKSAREELQHRLEARLPARGAKDCARTFHSLGLMIFQRELDPRKEWFLDTSGALYNRLVESIYKREGVRDETKLVNRIAELMKSNLIESPRQEAVRRLSDRLPSRLLAVAQEAAKGSDGADWLTALRVYLTVEDVRKKDGVEWKGERRRFVTFHDMIYETARLLERPETRERWADQWTHVLQDECQDENEAQAAIAEALAHKHRNYVVVGDPAQSIYAFRGATPAKMVAFPDRWPGAKTIFLFRNYRSGIEVVDAANALVGAMPANTVTTDEWGCPVEMQSERRTRAFVGHHYFMSLEAEANAIADNIVAHQAKGIPYSEQAVLLRLNKQSRSIEFALANRGIPYRLIAGSSLFDTRAAKAFFGYLRLMTCSASKDDFAAVLSNPMSHLGKAFLAKVADGHDMVLKDWFRSIAAASLEPRQQKLAGMWVGEIRQLMAELSGAELSAGDQTLYEAMRKADPVQVTSSLFDRKRGRLAHLYERDGDTDAEDANSRDTIDDIITLVRSFTSVGELMQKVDMLSRHRAKSGRSSNAVTVSTVHRAKGSEWGCVYVCGASAKMYPHHRCVDVNEERRVFYVACTRAKDELWVSHFHEDDTSLGSSVSPFVRDAGIPHHEDFEPGVRACKEPVGTQTRMEL